MTAQIIDFESKRREREQNKKAEQFLSVELASLNEEELKVFIKRLADFARAIEEVDNDLRRRFEYDQEHT